MTLVTTVSGSSSDSYVTHDEYLDYVRRNIDPEFSGDSVQDLVHLRRAAQANDRRYSSHFLGWRTIENQALEWPRYTTTLIKGRLVPSDEVPSGVKQAQMEMAYLLSSGGVDAFPLIEGAVVEEQVGPIKTKFQGGYSRPRLTVIEETLRPYLSHGFRQVLVLR